MPSLLEMLGCSSRSRSSGIIYVSAWITAFGLAVAETLRGAHDDDTPAHGEIVYPLEAISELPSNDIWVLGLPMPDSKYPSPSDVCTKIMMKPENIVKIAQELITINEIVIQLIQHACDIPAPAIAVIGDAGMPCADPAGSHIVVRESFSLTAHGKFCLFSTGSCYPEMNATVAGCITNATFLEFQKALTPVLDEILSSPSTKPSDIPWGLGVLFGLVVVGISVAGGWAVYNRDRLCSSQRRLEKEEYNLSDYGPLL